MKYLTITTNYLLITIILVGGANATISDFTALGSGTSSSTNSSTTGSINITPGMLLFTNGLSASAGAISSAGITDTFGCGLVWTKELENSGSIGTTARGAIWTTITNCTASGTITVAFTGATRTVVDVSYITDYNGTSWQVQKSNKTGAASTTPFITLTTTPKNNSVVYGAVHNRCDGRSNAPGAGSAYTELQEICSGGTPAYGAQSEYDRYNANETINWTHVGGTDAYFAFGIEVAENESAPPTSDTTIIDCTGSPTISTATDYNGTVVIFNNTGRPIITALQYNAARYVMINGCAPFVDTTSGGRLRT